MDDLHKARQMLDSGSYTCAVCRRDVCHTATERGVKPLLDWLDSGLDLENFSAADRVVGCGAAYLYCLLKVRAVYARVMSCPAAAVLQAHGIHVEAQTLVEGIINRKGTGPCPFEEAVLPCSNAQEALTAIRAKMKQM